MREFLTKVASGSTLRSIGSWPFRRADWIKLMIAAARLPLRNDPAKSQYLRQRTHGLIWFSAQSLSMGTVPSSRY